MATMVGLAPLVVACEEGGTSADATVVVPAAGGVDGEGGSTDTSPSSDSDDPVPSDADDDSDQDNIRAADDNCPSVFNPDQSEDACDGTKDEFDDENPCGFSAEAQAMRDNGDESTNTIGLLCRPAEGTLPLDGLGAVIFDDGKFVFIDVSDDELDTLRGNGVHIEEVDTVGTVTPEILIEARIKLDPAHALATADTDHLAEVDPEVLLTVPDDVIAELPDDTLAALPADFWTKARPSTIDVVGKDRLVRANPDVTPATNG